MATRQGGFDRCNRWGRRNRRQGVLPSYGGGMNAATPRESFRPPQLFFQSHQDARTLSVRLQIKSLTSNCGIVTGILTAHFRDPYML